MKLYFRSSDTPMSKTWPTLYVKTASGQINYWKIHTEGPVVATEWGKVGTSSPSTDSYTAEGKSLGRANETSPEAQAELEAQSKYDKQVRVKYLPSIEEAQSGLNIKPMRCYALDDKRRKKLTFPLYEQPKFNGCRCMAYVLPDSSVRLMSRGGKDYVVDHIQRELQGHLEAGWCLDGELYVHGMSLQKIRSLILTPSDASLQLQFVVYDMTPIPPEDLPWTMRYHHMHNWFNTPRGKALKYVCVSDGSRVLDLKGIEEAHDRRVKEGYEGVILRMPQGKYKLASKSTEVLKYKKFQDAEFKVVGWSVGKDGVIVYKCVQEEGKVFEVRPIGDEAERAELLKAADASVGQLLTVKFQERSDDNVPIFPVGLAFRGKEDLD
jgi:DNA ligase 1